MCLYTREKQPRIAKRDIVVLKYLNKDGKRYESPCQGTPVTLGKLMVAQPYTPNINYECEDLYDRAIYSIGGGVIHARLSESNKYGNYCAKAIIPKGTEYWIDSFGTDIAARKMLITDEEGSNESVDNQIFNEILESAPEKNGIRVGDYQMIDDSFVHHTIMIDKTKVRGIVCGFYEGGSPIICALEKFREVWDSDRNSKIGEYTSLGKVMKLFNGREVTAQYKKQINGKDKERFDAFERCIDYRKDKKEDWYFGSFGETMTMLDNAAYINAAHSITGLGFIINSNYWYCSCYEGYSYCSLCLCFRKGRVYCGWYCKGNYYSIVPFYAFEQAKKI